MGRIIIGTSGYNYKHWKGVFYPKGLSQKKWLSFYSKYFNTVEINATFYGNFKKDVFKKWASKVSKGFSFCLKGPRFITHVKRIKNVELRIKNFFENAYGLGSKLKIILWQFPKSFKLNDENFKRLKNFLSIIPKSTRYAFEFRDSSWFSDDLYNLFNKHKIALVIPDSPRMPKPLGDIQATVDFSYIRFHSPLNLYSSNYSDNELKEWAKKIKKMKRNGDVYCYFNNDAEGYAIKNAIKLKNILKD